VSKTEQYAFVFSSKSAQQQAAQLAAAEKARQQTAQLQAAAEKTRLETSQGQAAQEAAAEKTKQEAAQQQAAERARQQQPPVERPTSNITRSRLPGLRQRINRPPQTTDRSASPKTCRPRN